MILKSLLWGCAFASVGFAAQAATFANGGFELGDLSGWSSSGGVVEVVTAADDAIVTPPFGAHYDPVEGDYFAILIECLFQDNKQDLALLEDSQFCKKVEDWIVDSIEDCNQFITKKLKK